MTWTFEAPKAGVYQVTLPVKPGADIPDLPSYAWPHSWHPDGSVRSLCVWEDLLDAGGQRVPSLRDESWWTDVAPSSLPPPPVVAIDQGVPGWWFATKDADWTEQNTGAYAKRECRTRLVSAEGNACDFFLVYRQEFWEGKPMREHADIYATRPDEAGETQRNFPLATVSIGAEVVLATDSIGDGMRVPLLRTDFVEYARCDQWAEFDSGPYGGNRIRETIEYGGDPEDMRTPEKLISEGEAQLARPWYGVSDYCHPENGAGTGMHGDFGAHSEDTFTRFDTDVAKALHDVLGHYDAYIYHNRTMDGAPQRRADYPDNHSNSPLGEIEKGPRPWFGKVEHDDQGNPCEEPDRRGRKNEDNAHMRSVKLEAAWELCPTPWLMDELADRANAMQFFPEKGRNWPLPQVRSNWRAIVNGLGVLPFIKPGYELAQDVTRFVDHVFEMVLHAWRSSGNKPYDWKRPTEHCSLVGAMEAACRSGHVAHTGDDQKVIADVADYCLWNFWKAFGDDGQSDWRVLYELDPAEEDGEKNWASGTNGGQPLGMFLHWVDENYGWPQPEEDAHPGTVTANRVTSILNDQRDDRLCRWLPQPLKVATEPDPTPPDTSKVPVDKADLNRFVLMLERWATENESMAEGQRSMALYIRETYL